MRYMLLIYDREADWTRLSEEEQGALFHEYMTFTNDIKKSGHHLAGDPLQPVATATTVRVRGGKTLTTDGPFVEMKEALGGYLFFEADDLDAAIELAGRIPAARMGGAIEIRPIGQW